MSLRIVYPSKIPYFLVQIKTKKFFLKPHIYLGMAFLHIKLHRAHFSFADIR